MQALILAGGKGTRLRPLTVYTPKPIVPICNRPFLLYQIDTLRRAGITDITLSLSYQPNKIEQLLGDGSDYGVNLKYTVEPQPMGTAGAYKFAEDLIRGLIRQGVDVTAVRRVVDPAQRGFGHAFGFIIERLAREGAVPMLPVLLNTYFPPNTPTSARCFEIGMKIAAALAASPSAARVAVIASGGLSHFLCEEAFDRRVLAALRARAIETLTQIPQEALLSGSSEIRNWITVAGMVGHLELDFMEYIPVRRTPLGTGIGLAFVTWGAGATRSDGQTRSALPITEEQS